MKAVLVLSGVTALLRKTTYNPVSDSCYVTGKSDASQSPKQAREAVSQVYPNWPETARFVRDVRREVLDRFDADTRALTFDDAVRVVEEIGERYGRWQDRECRELKHDLMKFEHQGTGRVLLRDFYGAAAGGAWQFSENVEYLRQIGALDESDPARLKVIIANYIKERTRNAQFIIISLRNNMFELADRLVGIYKTHHCTKSVTINPAMLAAHLPAPASAPQVAV